MNILESKPHSQHQSRLSKYNRETSDIILCEALEDWREQKTATVFGRANLNDLGPSLVMPNTVLDRVVDAAHHYKIHSVQDLKKETGWTRSEQYGEEVVAIVQRLAVPRPSPFVSTPLRLSSAINHVGPTAPSLSVPVPAFQPHAASIPASLSVVAHSAPIPSISVPGGLLVPLGDLVTGNENKPPLVVPVRKRRLNRCSACGQEGHNGK